MAEFSLALNEDQLQLQKWVHGFAEEVVRPAAAEWDEREETPWPVLEEAARIGLYSLDFFANAFADRSGQTLPVVLEELFWGDAGIGLSIVGSVLGVAGIVGQGTPEQVGEWLPQCFGTPERVQLAAFCVSEPDAGSDVSSLRTTRPLRRGDRRVGARRDQDVDHQRRHRRRARGGRHRRPGPRRPGAGVVRGAAGDGRACARGPSSPRWASGPATRPRWCWTGCGCRGAACWAVASAWRSGWPGPAGGQRAHSQAAMKTFEATRPGVAAQAIGIARAAYEYALDYAKERRQFGRAIIENQAVAFMLADMATEIEAARLLVRRAAWLAGNGEFTQAEGSMAKLKAGRVAVWATERAIQILGGAGYVRDHPVERWHRDAKIYDIFEGTEQIQQLVIARAISGLRIE